MKINKTNGIELNGINVDFLVCPPQSFVYDKAILVVVELVKKVT